MSDTLVQHCVNIGPATSVFWTYIFSVVFLYYISSGDIDLLSLSLKTTLADQGLYDNVQHVKCKRKYTVQPVCSKRTFNIASMSLLQRLSHVDFAPSHARRSWQNNPITGLLWTIFLVILWTIFSENRINFKEEQRVYLYSERRLTNIGSTPRVGSTPHFHITLAFRVISTQGIYSSSELM